MPLAFADLRFDRRLESARVFAAQALYSPYGDMYVFYREDAGAYRCIRYPPTPDKRTRVWMGIDPLDVQCMINELELRETHEHSKSFHPWTP
jgi:hypothetical protein